MLHIVPLHVAIHDMISLSIMTTKTLYAIVPLHVANLLHSTPPISTVSTLLWECTVLNNV